MQKTQYKQVVSKMIKTLPLPKDNQMIDVLLEAINDIAEGKDAVKSLEKARKIVQGSLKPHESVMVNEIFNCLSSDNKVLKEENQSLKEQVQKYQIKYLEGKKIKDALEKENKIKDEDLQKLNNKLQMYEKIMEREF